VLKRSQHSLTSMIRSSTQRRFSANNECLLIAARCSIMLSKFEVVSSRISMYLKDYTRLITSPLNTNSWHGSAKLNTMTFVFFTFIVNPHLAQNCLSAFNYCCSPTFDSGIMARSFAKNNSHTCTSTRAGAWHYLLSKCPSKVSKYNPKSRGLKGQPCFTSCWHLKLEVTSSFGWLMHTVSFAYIACKHCKKRPSTPRPTNTYQSISCGTISNAFLKSTK
jgi:hypothetical protein